MPLDTSIPLQVQIPKFEDYSQLAAQTQANALRAQVMRQEMEQNALRMRYAEEDRARAETARRQSAAAAAADKALLKQAWASQDPQAATDFLMKAGRPDLAKSVAEGRKTLAEASTKEDEAKIKAYDTAIDRHVPLLGQVRTADDAAKFTSMLYDDPVLGPDMARLMPREQAMAAAQQQFAADPVGFYRSHAIRGKDFYDATVKAAGVTQAPDLKKGERWNAEAGRVEAVPGSDIYVQQSAKHGKDYGALNDVNTTADMTIKTIDKILDPKNQTGFERNFGGYNAAMVTQYLPDAQDVKTDIETLKSQLKVAGLKLIRQGGSIGAMTEKEWPIVQNMLDTITPYMSEEKARDTLKEIQARINAIRDTAKDTYETTWGGSQYYKDTGKKDSKTTAPVATPSGASVSNW